MDFKICLSVTLLLSVWATAICDQIPDGVLHMECHDRYFMIAVDLSFTGNEPHFEAVDKAGVYPITMQYAAECGYAARVVYSPDRVELRASYFSCHTDNTDDQVFSFSFNLVMHEGQVTYPLIKTCSPSLPWAPREVTCELNYMEVSVRNDVACSTGTKTDDWDATVGAAYTSATSDWLVLFQRDGSIPMNLTEAHKRGYVFHMTDGRLVFRTPYGQPDSLITEVNGVPVEVVHATLFSRQKWIVLMVDLVAACVMSEGSYDNGGYMTYEIPEVLHPMMSGLHERQINLGADGELVEQSVAEERGYIVRKRNQTVQISIPYDAEGGSRKSFVSGGLFEFYMFDLYLEQLYMDEDHVDTRLRCHRPLVTPLLPRPLSTENQTILEEHTFTVYLGEVPEDVELAAVHLNGQELPVQLTNESSLTVRRVVHPDNTHGYTLEVPFDDPLVARQFSKEDAMMQHKLDINYTLIVLPENEPFYLFETVMVLVDVSPPVFEAVCSESGISFRLNYRPHDYLWVITIGSDPLTPELAAKNGYLMSNNSQSLQLEVPLYAHGYEYKNITLNGFSGTFEILVRDCETSAVQSSTVKTCPFTSNEFILCSSDGKMTAVADLSLAIPSGGEPARTNLIDKYCGPKETDDTRALFSFPLNSCGSIVKLNKEYVTYENKIFLSKKSHALKNPADSLEKVTMQCTYPLAGLYRLFSVYRFESDREGVGRLVHSTNTTGGLMDPTMEPTTVTKTPPSTTRRRRRPVSRRPAYHPAAQYIKVPSFLWKSYKKGTQESQVKVLDVL